ncbi:hypothetical protein [Stakelama marina]|uniref:Sugar transporter n=1 Tax=Stakelama marina TaxID=2826939 RepID=A0A8T4ICQ7_9SPHN|nr:hypothetical protein [Stakelama marina]MBR0552181.1 hypothetical protein [Stakelama marina]
MDAVIRRKPPAWFWAVAIILTLWGAMGVYGFYSDMTMSADQVARLSDYDRAFRANTPAWQYWVNGIAVWSGLLGSVLLLFRRRIAHALYVISLIAVVVLFAYVLVATDLIAEKGAAVTIFPIIIVLIAVLQVWFARMATRRGWIS